MVYICFEEDTDYVLNMLKLLQHKVWTARDQTRARAKLVLRHFNLHITLVFVRLGMTHTDAIKAMLRCTALQDVCQK